MAMISDSMSPAAASRNPHAGLSAGLKSLWREFFAKAFHPYRPELHYMRGPGPAWRAKYGEAAAFRLKSRNL